MVVSANILHSNYRSSFMNSHESQQQSTSSPGHKQDNLQKDNLLPQSRTPNMTGTAGFVPQSSSDSAADDSRNPSLNELIQMMKIDYSSLHNSATEANAKDKSKGEESSPLETADNLREASLVTTDPEIKALIQSIKESIFKLRYHGDYANRHLNFEQNWTEDANELVNELNSIVNTLPISCDTLSNLKERSEYFASESGKDIKAMMLAKELLVDLKSIKAELFSINAWQIANTELSKKLKGKDLLEFDEEIAEARNNLQTVLNKIDHNTQLKANLNGFKLGGYLKKIGKHANAITLWTSDSSLLNKEAQRIIKLLKGYRF